MSLELVFLIFYTVLFVTVVVGVISDILKAKRVTRICGVIGLTLLFGAGLWLLIAGWLHMLPLI